MEWECSNMGTSVEVGKRVMKEEELDVEIMFVE